MRVYIFIKMLFFKYQPFIFIIYNNVVQVMCV